MILFKQIILYFFLLVIPTFVDSNNSDLVEQDSKKIYTNGSNILFLNEIVEIMKPGLPFTVDGIEFRDISRIDDRGILFELFILTDIGEYKGEFLGKVMPHTMKGFVISACNDNFFDQFFNKDLFMLYHFKDIDESFSFELQIDKLTCKKLNN